MTRPSEPPTHSTVACDLRFELQGRRLPADYPRRLAAALLERLPWLTDEPSAGIHPVRCMPLGGGGFGISRRARLTLRLPLERVDEARVLENEELRLAGDAVRLGRAAPRAIEASGTVYTRLALLGPEDEGAFLAAVQARLAGQSLRCEIVIGRRGEAETPLGQRCGYSVMMHALDAADSLRLQEEGLGGHRLHGCGLVVPHKAVGPV